MTSIAPSSSGIAAGTSGSSAAPVSERYAWIVVALLALTNIVAWVDRQIMALLIPDIKADLGLSDTEIGMLHGLSFAIFYAVAGLPFGWLADRMNRKNLLAGGIAFWSLATTACGIARGFAGLFTARIFVGVGEATLNPTAISLISDLFKPHRRAVPLGLFAASGGLGAGIALFIGGLAITFVQAYGPFTVPGVGVLATWQATFVCVGLPGLLVAVLVLLVREPARTGDTGIESASWRAFFSLLKARSTFFIGFFVAYSLLSLTFFSTTVWAPAFLYRAHGWSAAEVGSVFGPVMIVGAALGGTLSGIVITWLEDRGWKNAPIQSLAFLLLVSSVPVAVAPLLSSAAATLAIWGVLVFVTVFCGGAALTIVQASTPNRFRGKMTALLYTTTTIVGSGLGPLILGVFNNYLFTEAEIGRSLALLAALALPVGGVIAWLVSSRFERFE